MQLKNGERVVDLGDGKTRTEYVENFNITKVELTENGTTKVTISKLDGYDGIVFDANNNVQTGTIKSSYPDIKTEIIVSYENGVVSKTEQWYNNSLVCRVSVSNGIEYGSGIANLNVNDPTNAIPFILDKEVSSSDIDRNAALVNIKGAFDVYKNNLNDTLADTFKEYAMTLMTNKIVDMGVDLVFKDNLYSFAAKASGLIDALKNGIDSTYGAVTSFGSQCMYGVWAQFDDELQKDTLITKQYNYFSEKYDPTLTQQKMDDLIQAAWGSIPVLGELNLGIPKPGEVEHVALFKTQDSDGYYRLVEIHFNYGIFTDPSGAQRTGPTFAELTVWKAQVQNDPTFYYGLTEETHRSAP